jgi:hypothetical protein
MYAYMERDHVKCGCCAAVSENDFCNIGSELAIHRYMDF